ncbi:ATP-binding protein [Streptomyces sp. NPDC093516]|uniref:ATP-binding protein n=1 Tax=Streptomyces sp. NPDC093516 TaxID=3155304 RepID=UPI003419CC4B
MTIMTAARPRPKGHPRYRLTTDRIPQAAKEARNLTRVALAVWGLNSDTDAAELIMSELVANAARHARGTKIRLAVNRPAPDRVHLAVTDRAPDLLPQLLTPTDDSDRGRGLVLVDHLADRWGYALIGPARAPTSKRVWADLQVHLR